MEKIKILETLGATDIEEYKGTINFTLEDCPMEIESDEVYLGMTNESLESIATWSSYCCDVTLDKDTPICPKCKEWAR